MSRLADRTARLLVANTGGLINDRAYVIRFIRNINRIRPTIASVFRRFFRKTLGKAAETAD